MRSLIVVVFLIAAAGGCGRPALPYAGGFKDAGALPDALDALDAACVPRTRTLQPVPPDVLLVLDKSGSMRDDAEGNRCRGGCGPSSKWALVTAALDEVLAATDTAVNWGLKLFATPDNGCAVSAGVEVPVRAGNAPAIMSAIGGASLGSRTPVRAAENAGAAYLGTLPDSHPRYLLLATDGLPNCDPAQPNVTTADDSPGAEQAVADALEDGFPTFVIGIGNTRAEATLNRLAIAGGKPQTGGATSFYQVGDDAELASALGQILGAIPCTFDVGPLGLRWLSLGTVSVTANGVPVPRDDTHTDGWDFVPGGAQISVFGPTCDAITARAITNVTVAYGCAGG